MSKESSSRRSIVGELRRIFPVDSNIIRQPARICSHLHDEEALEVTQGLFQKKWTEVPADVWSRSSVLTFLTAEALLYYMPSLLYHMETHSSIVELSIDTLLSELEAQPSQQCTYTKKDRKFALSKEMRERMQKWQNDRWMPFNSSQLNLIKRAIERLGLRQGDYNLQAQIGGALKTLQHLLERAVEE